MGLALGTNLKFYPSLSKGLKLKVRKFWGLIPTFVEVIRKELVAGWEGGGGLFGPLPILNRLKGSLREKNNLKESQNKIIHVETLESAVRVKDKVLKNLKLSHDKFNEKVKERTFKLRPNAKSTDKLNEKLDRESE